MSKNAKQAALALVTPTAQTQTEEAVREQPRGPIAEVMVIDEAAAFLRISTRTLMRLLGAKRIPGKKVGGQWRFSRASLERYLGVPTTETPRYVYDCRGRPKD